MEFDQTFLERDFGVALLTLIPLLAHKHYIGHLLNII